MNLYGMDEEDDPLNPGMPQDPSMVMAPGAPRPNTPRDPDDPREKLRAYLEQKMGADKRMQSPEYRAAERAPGEALNQNNRDLALAKLFNNAANQAGTVGGKAASSQGFDQYAGDLQKSNADAMGQITGQRKDMAGAEDRNLKIQQYLSERYGKDEAQQSAIAKANAAAEYRKGRDATHDDFERQKIAAMGGKALTDQKGKADDRTIKLMKDYGDEEAVKRAGTYRDTWANAQALAKKPSPANDTAILYQYVRGNDPSTGVKDMELQIAQRSGPIYDQLQGFMEGMESGMMLPKKRAQILEAIKVQADAAEDRLLDIDDTYDNLSKQAGSDPEIVIGKRRSRAKRKTPEEMAGGPPKAGQKKSVDQMSLEELQAELNGGR